MDKNTRKWKQVNIESTQVNDASNANQRDQNALQTPVNAGQSGGDVLADDTGSTVESTDLPRVNRSDLGDDLIKDVMMTLASHEWSRAGHGTEPGSGAVGSNGPCENTRTLQ